MRIALLIASQLLISLISNAQAAIWQVDAVYQASEDNQIITVPTYIDINCSFCINIDEDKANVTVYNYGKLNSVIASIRGYGHFLNIYNYGYITGRYIGIDNVGYRNTFYNYGSVVGIDSDQLINVNNSSSFINYRSVTVLSGSTPAILVFNTRDNWIWSGTRIETNYIINHGTISTIANSIKILPSASEVNLINYGDIINTNGDPTISNYGAIDSIKNNGSIINTSSNLNIYNAGSINIFTNRQGGINPIVYSGYLPKIYNVIIESKQVFGRLILANVTGTMVFGVDSSSILHTGTYTRVLSGITAASISSPLSGNLWDTYTYSLIPESSSDNVWDLVLSKPPATVTLGGSNSLSNIGDAPSVSVSGGSLVATSNSNVTVPVQLTGSSAATIDASGNSATFSAPITSTSSAKLVISDNRGGGAVTLNAANNVIPGGVALSSGTLAIGDATNPNASLEADVAVSPASTLKGHGTIIGNIANNGGVVSPGGSIGTLSVSGNYTQGASSTLSIEVNPTQNSLLAINGAPGTANLAGTLSIVATAGAYTPRQYTIVTATGGISGRFANVSTNFSTYTSLASGVSYGTNAVYLTLYPFTLADTNASIYVLSSNLRRVFNIQAASLSSDIEADCTVFDKHGLCLSVSARMKRTGFSGSPEQDGLVVGSYRLHENFRLGAFVEQGAGTQSFGNIKLDHTNPSFGMFGVWSQNPDGEGFELRLSAGFSNNKLMPRRVAYGTSEAGSGSTDISTRALSAVLSYDWKAAPELILSPYIGLRWMRTNMSTYTETAPTAPLSYPSISQSSVTTLIGARFKAQLNPRLSLFGQIGLEQDIGIKTGQFAAAGLNDLANFKFNSKPIKTRPAAALGIGFDMDQNQRVSLSTSYRKQSYQNQAVMQTMLTYSVGF